MEKFKAAAIAYCNHNAARVVTLVVMSCER